MVAQRTKRSFTVDQAAFDKISKLFGAKAARRAAIAGTAGAIATAALLDAEAKSPKGNPTPQRGKRNHRPSKQERKTMFLFLQTSRGGSLADNGNGDYTLQLDGHHGGTIYFSDRPQRVFGVSPTDDFLAGLGFPAENPPNAALLVNAGDVEDVAIVELFDPSYDENTGQLTYRVRILEAYDETGLEHIADQIDSSQLPTSFDQASLFIDDCDDYHWCCRQMTNGAPQCEITNFDGLPSGRCWNWGGAHCGECWDGQYQQLSDWCAWHYFTGGYPSQSSDGTQYR